MKKTVSVLMLFVLLVFSFSALADELIRQESQVYTGTSEDGLSSDQALQGYIDRVFGVDTGIVPKAAPRGSLLKGKEAILYEYLAKEIGKAAIGDRVSTEFEIPYTLFLDKLSYNADDLGVDEIVQNNAIAEAAVNSFSQKTKVDVDAVHSALLVDYPYDLYWYDKTAGWRVSYGRITAEYSDTWYLRYLDDCMKVSLSVASEFSATGERGTYVMSESLPASIQTAAQTANAIVNTNSSKSDIEKLRAYKKAICDRVEYNNTAAAGGVAYGNPWQLIWVFDNDPATKVVCEGYSKAFKYLCDQSEFQSKLTVSLMSGVMKGGTGAGNHMWNLVAMGDGKNYLVDVTNCDEGTSGYPDYLFMAGYKALSNDPVYGAGYDYEGCYESTISYYYSDGTIALYSAQELAASSTDFDPSAYPTANLYGYTLIIPENTVYIDSQAFANLGEPVNILIRQNDISIADDAFSGSTIILIGPASLKSWADQKGIPFVLNSDVPE